MPKVFVLPDHIASQIAAGEVVERPASVVKELVENSVDAGATKIVISVERHCRDIRVSDDGCGMAPEDAMLAFQRHATSKLRSADDLWTLSTLGFRGEALPSVSSVAKVTCYTRTESAETGTQIDIENGNVTARETGCAVGTTLEITDLFFNVPARLNFLKKPATEFGHIFETVQALSITCPEVSFRLDFGGERRLYTSGSGDLTLTLLESGFAAKPDKLLEIDTEDPQLGLRLVARLGSPTNFRGDRRGILSVVNQRPVRCSLAYRALDYAFADLIPRGRFPLAFTALSLAPDQLDVNIHPTKKEIKYSRGNDIYMFLQRHFVRALRTSVQPQIHLPVESPTALSIFDEAPSISYAGSVATAGNTSVAESGNEVSVGYSDLRYAPQPEADLKPPGFERFTTPTPVPQPIPLDWRIAGYIHNTYIVLETEEGLSLVEQHIAHERVMYERLLNKISPKDFQTDHLQQLVISVPIALSPEQNAFLTDNLGSFASIGFRFEREAEHFVCTQLPVELANVNYSQVIQELVQSLMESASSTVRLEIAKSIACQSAVKNGMPLSNAQLHQLLKDWYNCPRNDTCPHGRPIQLSFTKRKLFQLFHPA